MVFDIPLYRKDNDRKQRTPGRESRPGVEGDDNLFKGVLDGHMQYAMCILLIYAQPSS